MDPPNSKSVAHFFMTASPRVHGKLEFSRGKRVRLAVANPGPVLPLVASSMARRTATPRPSVFVLPIRRTRGDTGTSSSQAAPFPLSKLVGDLLQQVVSYLTLDELCRLLRAGSVVLNGALAHHVRRAVAKPGLSQDSLVPSLYFPDVSCLRSLLHLELSGLASGFPWARALIRDVPNGLETLKLEFHDDFVEFFEQEPGLHGQPARLPHAPEFASASVYLMASYPTKASIAAFFAHFSRLSTLALHSSQSSGGLDIEAFFAGVPDSLTSLELNEGMWIRDCTCAECDAKQAELNASTGLVEALKALPVGLRTLRLPMYPLTLDEIAWLPPALTCLHLLTREKEVDSEVSALLPPGLTELHLASGHYTTDSFWDSCFPAQSSLISLTLPCIGTPFPSKLPPNLTELVAPCSSPTLEQLAALPRHLTKLVVEWTYMDLNTAETLPESLDQIGRLQRSAPAVIFALPRSLRYLQLDYLPAAMAPALPPALTEIEASLAEVEIFPLLPRSLFSLTLHMSHLLANNLLHLPPRLTALNLGPSCTIDDEVGGLLPKTLTKLSLLAFCIKLPTIASDSTSSAQPPTSAMDNPEDWTIPHPELEPERTAREIAFVDQRIQSVLSSLPDGLHCQFWFSCNGFFVKTSPYLHSLRPDAFEVDATHRIALLTARAAQPQLQRIPPGSMFFF